MSSLSRQAIRFLALALGFAACSDDKKEEPPLEPKIVAFTASATTVAQGGTVVLSYKVENADAVGIRTPAGATVLATAAAAEGSVTTPALAQTTTFVLTATGPGGSATASVEVRVAAPQMVIVSSFAASPDSLIPGEASTLTWTAMNASSGKIDDDAGASVLASAQLPSGSLTVSPAQSTTYVFTAQGNGGPVTQRVTITVRGPDITAFASSPPTLVHGDSATLSWSVVRASSVVIRDSQSNTVYSGPNLTGTAVITPDATDTYTLTATDGLNRTATQNVTVMVNPLGSPQIVSYTATRNSVDLGEPTLLAWTVNNAALGITITANGVTATTSSALIGTLSIAPTIPTLYRLTARNVDAEASADVTVTINQDNAYNGPNVPTMTGTSAVFQGSIVPTTDQDYFAIPVPEGYHMRAYLTMNSVDSCPAMTPRGRLTLYATDGTTLLGSDFDTWPSSPCAYIQPRPMTGVAYRMAAGTYFLRADELQSDEEITNYFLHITLIAPACGNGYLDPGEVCDDGNLVAGDGCNPACEVEVSGVFNAPGGTQMLTFPNDSTAQWLQFVISVPGQSVTATIADIGGTTCSVDTAIALFDTPVSPILRTAGGPGVCGAIRFPADIDATNLPLGTYRIYTILQNSPTGGTVQLRVGIIDPVCGNGVLESRAGEACDDGNVISGDGCSSTCQ